MYKTPAIKIAYPSIFETWLAHWLDQIEFLIIGISHDDIQMAVTIYWTKLDWTTGLLFWISFCINMAKDGRY